MRIFNIFAAVLLCQLAESASVEGKCKLEPSGDTSSGFWLEHIAHQGKSSYHADPNYKVFRNVKSYGAKGDGITDDTAAIGRAIADGNRDSTEAGDSSTLSPAVVYFPRGTYLVSSPLKPLYKTQVIGDALHWPTIKAAAHFKGSYVIDGDPYDQHGQKAYNSTNNFYKVIQNFRLDMTQLPGDKEFAGIHWPVAQATMLQNIEVNMAHGTRAEGLFIEEGSGGFMSDLSFNGGNIGMRVGNQQFTSRNMKFNGCHTAIQQIWNWAWVYKSVEINNCGVGIDLSVEMGHNLTVGSLLVIDSTFTNTPIALRTSTSQGSKPVTAGTLYIENSRFVQVKQAVADVWGRTILNGGDNVRVASWGQGHSYYGDSKQYMAISGKLQAPPRQRDMVDNKGDYYQMSTPQFEQYSVSQFASVKAHGAKGDGKTDDTAAIQRIFDTVAPCKIIFFDAGSYVVSSTIRVPANIKIVGEAWSTIMATGAAFSNYNRPQPVFQIGSSSGQAGSVQIVNMLFSNIGPVPGATMIEWNVRDPSRPSGLWNVHTRIGGSVGSLQAQCLRSQHPIRHIDPKCYGAYMSIHITRNAAAYLENTWIWTADHNLDHDHSSQVSIFTGRGILVESQGPTFMYGTSSEHSVLYQYQVANARNVVMFMIQTESPYFQSNPVAPYPFTPQSTISDPTFANCGSNNPTCAKAWGLRVTNSHAVYLYGAGLYSFFENYDQRCILTNTCQKSIYDIENSQDVYTFLLSTIAAESMVSENGRDRVPIKPNMNVYPGTILSYLDPQRLSKLEHGA